MTLNNWAMRAPWLHSVQNAVPWLRTGKWFACVSELAPLQSLSGTHSLPWMKWRSKCWNYLASLLVSIDCALGDLGTGGQRPNRPSDAPSKTPALYSRIAHFNR
eukprot:scaffold179253_cov19-Tisochrysis_lutea.AAC.1